MIKFDKILVPTDFSAGSALALDNARQLVRSTGGELHILYVQPLLAMPFGGGMLETNYADAEQMMVKEARDKLDGMKKELEAAGIKCVAEVKSGSPVELILGYAKENHVNMICICTHGTSGLEHFLFGSTTEKVLRKAECPVLVVRFAR